MVVVATAYPPPIAVFLLLAAPHAQAAPVVQRTLK